LYLTTHNFSLTYTRFTPDETEVIDYYPYILKSDYVYDYKITDNLETLADFLSKIKIEQNEVSGEQKEDS